MTDTDARQLLALLALYAKSYGPDVPPLVFHLGDDLISTLDESTPADEANWDAVSEAFPASA